MSRSPITGSAGHAGATANVKLTFHLDHSVGGLIRQSKEEGSKMTGSPAAQTNGSGRGMLLRFLVLGGLLLTSQGMAIAQDPLPYTSLKAYIVDLKASIQQRAESPE